ncbi:hypothetical protein ACLB2K_053090 [Fragaria x ananassa]
MATSALIGAKPMTSLKHSSTIPFSRLLLSRESKTPAMDNPNPLEAIFNETLASALKVLKTHAMAAVLLSLLLTFHPNLAWAASGGRVGGSSFSSRSRSSSSSSSRSSSYSSSSSRSSSPSYSYKSYSSYSNPRPSSSSSTSSSSSSSSSNTSRSEADTKLLNIILAILVLIVAGCIFHLASVTETSNFVNRVAPTSNVVKLQKSYLGDQCKLRFASVDLGDQCKLRFASVVVTPNYNMEDAEKCFNNVSIEERAKFDKETLVNVNNKRRKVSRSKTDDGFQNQYIVATLLVAIEGKHKLPATINSSDDLKEALKNLGSIPPMNILAAEVLWTPQEENDTLSEEELIEDYPLLKVVFLQMLVF